MYLQTISQRTLAKTCLNLQNPKKPLYNFPGGGRRPPSLTCPSIITKNKGHMVMVLGGSGGMRILLSIAWVTIYYILVILLYFFTVFTSEAFSFYNVFTSEAFSF